MWNIFLPFVSLHVPHAKAICPFPLAIHRTTIWPPCRHLRGFQARQELRRRQAAALTIQRAVRQLLERWQRERTQRAVETMKRQMMALAQVMHEFSCRSAAATRLQAHWRGHLGRRAAAVLREEREQGRRLEAARRAAAMEVLAAWVPVFRDRLRFLRLRAAAPVLQRWWRREFARRAAAATVIQAAVRAHLAGRQLRAARRAATAIQAQWRGHHTRSTHPMRRRLAETRARLAQATMRAKINPGLTLEARTASAIKSIQASRHIAAVSMAGEGGEGSAAALHTPCCQVQVDARLLLLLGCSIWPGLHVQPRPRPLHLNTHWQFQCLLQAAAPLQVLATCAQNVQQCREVALKEGMATAVIGLIVGSGRSSKADHEGLRSAFACLTNLCIDRCMRGGGGIPFLLAGKQANLIGIHIGSTGSLPLGRPFPSVFPQESIDCMKVGCACAHVCVQGDG